jgi:hypothetical protein
MPKSIRIVVSGRHTRRVALQRCAFFFAFASGCLAADSTDPGLAIQISSETAPAGGWTQLKVFLTTPAPARSSERRQQPLGDYPHVASGSISMDLDPAVFGDISGVAVFSATGDAMGYANVNHQHVDAHFYSPSAWLGGLPDMPVFAVWVPVLASAAPGAATSVSLDPSGSQLFDAQGNQFAMTVESATFTVGALWPLRT